MTTWHMTDMVQHVKAVQPDSQTRLRDVRTMFHFMALIVPNQQLAVLRHDEAKRRFKSRQGRGQERREQKTHENDQFVADKAERKPTAVRCLAARKLMELHRA